MEERLNLLKTNFISIIEIKESNLHIFEILQSRIAIIKQTYADFICNHKQNLFIFTLDSFHFQGKLIDIEYEEMTRIFHAIMNKMYCEYYKLYKIVAEYVNENIKEDKILNLIQANNQYPVYKDLEPYKQYDFHYIKELHESILVILNAINGYLMNKEHDLKIYQNKNENGFNIDNFVNTLNFNNIMMKEKIQLFITYIEFFHKMHTKYLSRFTTKMQLMLSQINYDIKFEGNVKTQEKTNKNVLKTLKKDFGGENRELLSDLRHMITDEDTETTTDQAETPSDEKVAIYHFQQRDSSPSLCDYDEPVGIMEASYIVNNININSENINNEQHTEPVVELSIFQKTDEPRDESRDEPRDDSTIELSVEPTESRDEPIIEPTIEPTDSREEPTIEPEELISEKDSINVTEIDLLEPPL